MQNKIILASKSNVRKKTTVWTLSQQDPKYNINKRKKYHKPAKKHSARISST